jgi:hypothetical protein
MKVFVVGSSRSGTTLVNSLLAASGRFAAYRAEAQLVTLCQQKYGRLRPGHGMGRFLRDWSTSRPFLRSGLQLEEFAELARQHLPDWYQLTGAFLDAIALRQSKDGWVESTPGHVFHLQPLSQAIPDALFLHVVRDGRSVAVSRRKLGWTVVPTERPHLQLLYAGLAWRQAVRAARTAAPYLGRRMMQVRYEDLVTDPEPVIGQLNQHIFPDEVVPPIPDSKRLELNGGNTAFGPLAPGLDPTPLRRWREHLDDSEAASLTWHLAEELYDFGYIAALPACPGVRERILKHWLKVHLTARTWLARRTILGRLTAAVPELET